VEVSWSATEVGTGRTLVVGGKWSEVK